MTPGPSEICRDPQRRQKLRGSSLHGIDYIEVSDDRLTLTVFFVGRASNAISVGNVRITGGVRVRDIKAVGVVLRDLEYSENDNCLDVAVDRPGDLSTYTLSLVDVDENDQPTDRPMAGFDPRYAQANFSFNIGRAVDFDCKPRHIHSPPELPTPEINYLAKDYESFRQLILDRLAVTMPAWQERHIPDVGITLAEILAYVGDHLSYYQDAVATEAYLDTARQRISVRRHVRLIDYAMHEGCNARAWVFIKTSNDTRLEDSSKIHFLAGRRASDTDAGLTAGEVVRAAAGQFDIFAPIMPGPVQLYEAHNEIGFYTWGDRVCCLEAGATAATLRDSWHDHATSAPSPAVQPAESRSQRKRSTKSAAGREASAKSPPPAQTYHAPPSRERKLRLQPGDFLLFEEVLGPASHSPEDASPAHRHVVRLTGVKSGYDPLYDQPVVEISWDAEDALPFALRVDCTADGRDISVARGNVILADHGNSFANDGWIHSEVLPDQTPGKKYRPVLKSGPLTFCQPSAARSAAHALIQDPRSAVPQITVFSIPPTLDGARPLFTFADLKNPLSFADKLANSDDSASRILRDHLPSGKDGVVDKVRNAPADLEAVTMALTQGLEPFLRKWNAQRDLLASGPSDCHFVVEMDDDGYAHLRFGDGQLGRAPEVGEVFAAMYRVGIGALGNVGAEAINQIVATEESIGATLTPRNPLPAAGGTDPESIANVKLAAPKAFQGELMRAVSADDYARLAERNPRVQRAAAELRWTGIRYEAHVAIDPLGTELPDAKLLRRIKADLHRYRRIGHEVTVVPPNYIPLDIAITVRVLPGYLRSHVEAALLDNFSNRALPGGRRGIFHPDNLSFGDSIHVSKLIAAAQCIAGVESVALTRLQRRFAGPEREIENGVLPIGPLEVARLDNDPLFPENGRLVLTLRGGQ